MAGRSTALVWIHNVSAASGYLKTCPCFSISIRKIPDGIVIIPGFCHGNAIEITKVEDDILEVSIHAGLHEHQDY